MVHDSLCIQVWHIRIADKKLHPSVNSYRLGTIPLISFNGTRPFLDTSPIGLI